MKEQLIPLYRLRNFLVNFDPEIDTLELIENAKKQIELRIIRNEKVVGRFYETGSFTVEGEQ